MAWLVVMAGEFTLSQLRQCIEIAMALLIAALAVLLTYMGFGKVLHVHVHEQDDMQAEVWIEIQRGCAY